MYVCVVYLAVLVENLKTKHKLAQNEQHDRLTECMWVFVLLVDRFSGVYGA